MFGESLECTNRGSTRIYRGSSDVGERAYLRPLQISANPRFGFSSSTLAATSTSRQVCRSDDDSSNDST
jgi:hypothetical protein